MTAVALDPRGAPVAGALRQENEERLAADLAARARRPRSLPRTVRIDTTASCALGCLHCFHTAAGETSGGVMDLGLWNLLAEELFPRIGVIELGFEGEPLADPLLGERLAAIGSDGPRVHLTTSGAGLGEALGELMPVLGTLTISLETTNEADFRFGRPKVPLPALLRALARFRQLRGEAAGRPRLEFRVAVFEGNQRDLPQIVARLAREGADAIRFVHGLAYEGAPAPLAPPHSPEQLGIALQRAVHQGQVSDVEVHYPARPPVAAATGASGAIPPAGTLAPERLWTHGAVDAAGMVSFCCPGRRLAGAPAVLLDRTKGFRDAWTSPAFQYARAATVPPGSCALCPHGGSRHG